MTNRQQNNGFVVAAFDFDGTLTTVDTMIAFIRFTHGSRRLFLGFLHNAYWILLMMLGLYPNWRAKERIFTFFYKGTTHKQFVQWSRDFANICVTMLNNQTVETLKRHLAEGHEVCVVTASIDEWVRPVCEQLGVNKLLATRIEVATNGTLTGLFQTPNCYGVQKVARLLEAYPHRLSYKLYAYGDSHGDDELMTFSDKGFRVNQRRPWGQILSVILRPNERCFESYVATRES